jgi:hypothetical protein
MIAFRSGSNDRFAVSSSMSLISNATIARPATDLGPGGAHGCAYGRCLVSLGGPRRAALVGGSTAGRLCYGRLPGGPPPTIAGLAVAPVSITAASCNRSGLWRSSLSLECKGPDLLVLELAGAVIVGRRHHPSLPANIRCHPRNRRGAADRLSVLARREDVAYAEAGGYLAPQWPGIRLKTATMSSLALTTVDPVHGSLGEDEARPRAPRDG